jgi:uncharacterized membrane protein
MSIRVIFTVLVSVSYMVWTHWLMTRAGESAWNVVGVLTPMLIAIGVGTWRSGQHVLGIGVALLLTGLCVQAGMGFKPPTRVLYLAQHAGIHMLLAFGFGTTLRAGQTPLITSLAARVHDQLTPDMTRYTRKLTAAWTLYFISMLIISVALFTFADFEVWALFANVLTPIFLMVIFIAEYWLRYQLHPEFERVSIKNAMRSYSQHGKHDLSP